MLRKIKYTIGRLTRKERGYEFVMVLILLLIGGLMIPVMLPFLFLLVLRAAFSK
jgi:hypothetical protein